MSTMINSIEDFYQKIYFIICVFNKNIIYVLGENYYCSSMSDPRCIVFANFKYAKEYCSILNTLHNNFYYCVTL